MSSQNEIAPSDIVWGAEAIAPYIGRTLKGTFGALETGRIPGAKKIAGRWALHVPTYLAAFKSEVAA
jgi:hypothetical protein